MLKDSNSIAFSNVSDDQHLAVIRRVLDMLGKLKENRITHSDLKHPNILITDHGPVLIDLDAIQAHNLAWTGEWKGRKYMDRFRKSLDDTLSI